MREQAEQAYGTDNQDGADGIAGIERFSEHQFGQKNHDQDAQTRKNTGFFRSQSFDCQGSEDTGGVHDDEAKRPDQ